jgi:hypothetical protein
MLGDSDYDVRQGAASALSMLATEFRTACADFAVLVLSGALASPTAPGPVDVDGSQVRVADLAHGQQFI